MSSYCSANDEWLIMKLCIYIGYHDANNVSNFGGDPVTQLFLKKSVFFVSVRRHVAILLGANFACMSGTMMPTMCQIFVVTQLNLKNVFVYESGLIAIHEVSPPFHEGHTSLSTALVNSSLPLRGLQCKKFRKYETTLVVCW